MGYLHRYPDEAAFETRGEELRGEALGRPPFAASWSSDGELGPQVVEAPSTLERWDLVESRWSPGSVMVLVAGAALAVLGVVAAARTGIDDTWHRPVETVAGLRHTPLLAALEVGAGVLLVITGLAGARGLAALVCITGAMAAGVAAIEPELVADELALQRWWAITRATDWRWCRWCPGRTSSNATTPAPQARPPQPRPMPTPCPRRRRSGRRTEWLGHDVARRGSRGSPGARRCDVDGGALCPPTGTGPSLPRTTAILHANQRGGAPRAGPAAPQDGTARCRRRTASRRDRRDTDRDAARSVAGRAGRTTRGVDRGPARDRRPRPDHPGVGRAGCRPGRMGPRRQPPARSVLCCLPPRHRPSPVTQMARHPLCGHLRIGR